MLLNIGLYCMLSTPFNLTAAFVSHLHMDGPSSPDKTYRVVNLSADVSRLYVKEITEPPALNVAFIKTDQREAIFNPTLTRFSPQKLTDCGYYQSGFRPLLSLEPSLSTSHSYSFWALQCSINVFIPARLAGMSSVDNPIKLADPDVCL